MIEPRRTSHRRAYNEPGHAHELTFACYHRYRFFSAERTCQWFCESVEEARRDLDFALWAFVIMPEYVHLIVWPRKPVYEISAILKAIWEPVGRHAVGYLAKHAPHWLSRITRHRGQRVERLFWQSGGGFDRNIWEPKTLMSMIDHVHMNPLRPGLVAKARDWRWSSAGWFEGTPTCGLVPDRLPPEWVPQD
ncbi:MAG: transposase [Isosphaeraceae bacterium]